MKCFVKGCPNKGSKIYMFNSWKIFILLGFPTIRLCQEHQRDFNMLLIAFREK